MRKSTALIVSSFTLIAQAALTDVSANEVLNTSMPQEEQGTNTNQQTAVSTNEPFSPFTGKVTKSKVRLRLQPNLESPVLKELSQGDMLIVLGETEDFYAVQPPAGLKSYVFRTYILDNVVEASRVNVRLEPDLDAPIIAQLRAGDRIEGNVSALNSKWFEISPPNTARFYVAKDYIEKLGDPSVLATIEKKRDEVNILLNSTYLTSQNELQKAFPEINLDLVYANLNKIINEQKNFPEQAARAKEILSSVQDTYLQKKISYLEAKTKIVQDDWQTKNAQLNEQVKSQQQKVSSLEQQLKRSKGAPFTAQNSSNNVLSIKMTAWLPAEQALYDTWAQTNIDKTQEDFYYEQRQRAVALRGLLEPYSRAIRNKPGDYVLVNQSNHLPIAYLYSTQINLQDKVGHEVTIYGAPRDNRGFAFPAFFVLGID